jgi:hypothetical protein
VDIEKYEPDIVLIDFAVNDMGPPKLMEALMRKTLSMKSRPIVLLASIHTERCNILTDIDTLRCNVLTDIDSDMDIDTDTDMYGIQSKPSSTAPLTTLHLSPLFLLSPAG